MSAPSLSFLKKFPAFRVISQDGSRIRVRVALDKPRTVSAHDDFGAAAYVAGIVKSSSGEEEPVFAFLVHEEGVRLLPGAPRMLKAASVEGVLTDHVSTIGFSLWECTVQEEPIQPPETTRGK